MNVVSMARNYVFIKYRSKFNQPVLLFIFILIFTLAAVYTWQGIISLLPLGGVVISSIAYWQKKTNYIRALSLLASPMWLLYNFLSGSYPGMIIEVFVIASLCVAIWRYDIMKKPEPALLADKLKLSE